MAKKKFPSISEVCEWRAFECDGEQFNLRHLDAQIVEYDNPYPGPDKYRFYVTYGFHCFTTSRPDEDSLGEYHSPKESRPFCRKRYELSKYLPDLVARLAGEDTRCYFAGYSRYATIELTLDSGEIIHYMMVFKTFREKKKLRLHVESAYPLEKRPGKMKKIKFLVIARKTLLGKEIKQTE